MGACAGSKVPRDIRTAFSAKSGVLPALGARAAPRNMPPLPSCLCCRGLWALAGELLLVLRAIRGAQAAACIHLMPAA